MKLGVVMHSDRLDCKDYLYRRSYQNGFEILTDQKNMFLIKEIDTHNIYYDIYW